MKQPTIFWLALGVIIGVAGASWLSWPLILLGLLSLIVLGWPATRWPVLPVALGLLVGVGRVSLSPLTPSADDIAQLAGGSVHFSGEVVGLPEERSGKRRAVVRLTGQERRGRVLVTVATRPDLRPGDLVTCTGKLARPPQFPDFDYRRYLAKSGIHSQMTGAQVTVLGHRPTLTRSMAGLRESFTTHLKALFPDTSEGFLLGILIGDRSDLPETMTTAFRRTGTTHVLALSGYNISIVIAVIVGLLGRQPRVLWLALLGVAAFVWFVGPSASVLRAALMGGLLLLAGMLGRPQPAIQLCLIAAAVLLIFAPWSLRYDLGFDLSFLATLGILILEPPVRRRLQWLPRLIREPVAATLAASVPTAPLIASTFGTVSLVAPLANVTIVPAVPWLMLGGFAATLLSYLNETAARILGAVTASGTELVLNLIAAMASWPLAQLDVTNYRTAVALVLLGLAGIVSFRLYRETKPQSVPVTT